MTEEQVQTLNQMRNVTKCEVTLITKETLGKYMLPQHPLHSSYNNMD
jgi:hypothetical protein